MAATILQAADIRPEPLPEKNPSPGPGVAVAGGASHAQRENHRQIVERLRAARGEWHRVTESASFAERGSAGNVAMRIRDGLLAAYRPAGHFEAVVRDGATWARYVGAPE